MIDFVITTHRGREGARLSRPGHWGNVPFDTVNEAERTAKDLANGLPFTIEREHFNTKLTEFGS